MSKEKRMTLILFLGQRRGGTKQFGKKDSYLKLLEGFEVDPVRKVFSCTTKERVFSGGKNSSTGLKGV